MDKWTVQDRYGNIILYRTEMIAYDGTPVRFVYDQEADILEIFFGENEPATGIELTDHIILRLNRQTRRAISLMLLHFSQFLKLSYFQTSPARQMPLTFVESQPIMAAA
jgi:hypothetical protein